MNKKLISILLLIVLMLSGCSGAKDDLSLSYPFEVLTSKDIIEAQIQLANDKVIELELYPEIAPVTVSNFMYLANEGFYDGLIFHRVISGFMIQGGCPNGIGTGGPNYRIKGEFKDNGVNNPLNHTRGVISMARTSNSYDSAGSQFFIMHRDYPSLDGQYAAFGRVTEGMDVVDEIASVMTDSNDKPLEDIVIKTIIIK
ncbi:MAG: peptidylprolyl isomerase [Clostridia bacterium]|nr:peptidylprolyl isomerase [Clostridia bacterium]